MGAAIASPNKSRSRKYVSKKDKTPDRVNYQGFCLNKERKEIGEENRNNKLRINAKPSLIITIPQKEKWLR